MKQITIRQLVRQGNVSKLKEWMPCEVVADGKVIGILSAPVVRQRAKLKTAYANELKHDVRQANTEDSWDTASLYVSGDKAPGVRELREDVFNLLGHQCVWCGFNNKRALQIDHINGGGRKDIASFSSMTSYYKHILEVRGKGYQTLCANCNTIKARGYDMKGKSKANTMSDKLPELPLSKHKQAKSRW